MSRTCSKHRARPVTVYRQCVGCEIEGQRAEIDKFKAERDAMAQRCRELEAENEDLVFALSDAESRADNAGRNASAFEDRMGDLQVSNGKLIDAVADLKARLLDAERGNEELVRLRAENRGMRDLLAESAEYLNTNQWTRIEHGSVLHRKMMEASK